MVMVHFQVNGKRWKEGIKDGKCGHRAHLSWVGGIAIRQLLRVKEGYRFRVKSDGR